MSQRRAGVQHVKLNFLKKSQFQRLSKNGRNSSLRDKNSFERTLTLQEEQKQFSHEISAKSTDVEVKSDDEESPIENVSVSQFTYNKLCLIQKNLFFSTITQMFFAFLLVEIQKRSSQSHQQTILLILMSLISILVGTLILLRKSVLLKLKIDQKLQYHYKGWKLRKYLSSSMVALISNKRQIIETLLEFGIGFVHPNLLTRGLFYNTYDEDYDIQILQSVNNLLGVLMILKIFLILRSLINLTKFVTPRVVRVCNMNQLDYNLMYSIKCIQKEYPIRFIFIPASLVLIMFGYGFRISEGTVTHYNNQKQNGFEQLFNCLWFVFQTMYTIGYGEYCPRTYIGKFLAATLSVVSISINSMLMVSVFDYLQMKNQEEKSLTLIHRMEKRKFLEKQASKAVKFIIEISELMSSLKNSSSEKLIILKDFYEKMRFQMDQVKKYRLQIKNFVPLNDQTETMLHFFIRLRQNFAEVCKNQISVQILLQSDKLRDGNTRRSIGEHFKSFIRKTLTMTPAVTMHEI